MQRTALVQSGIAAGNSVIADQLRAGAHSFTVPGWLDLSDDEANIASDDPDQHSSPRGLGSFRQVIRKAFLHGSWSTMNLASEISGDDPMARIQQRVQAYWDRQIQKRLIASLSGILAQNLEDDAGDMVLSTTDAFSAAGVIDAAGTLGDRMDDLVAVAMHSDTYRRALKSDLIDFIPDSEGSLSLPTFRGLAVIQDDSMPKDGDDYTTVLFGAGAVGYAVAAPRTADGTEVESIPSAGNGGGQQVLHSRLNVAIHPAGFSWTEDSVSGESPTIGELKDKDNWTRPVERKAVPLVFYRHQL
ncbi:hypothetical protein LRE06_09600 [Halorhodospira halophila]|nr:hypothetical protein [Halorhodospira halophila]MCG5528597.1 hypothetical protein [Halorhodospira halophila]